MTLIQLLGLLFALFAALVTYMMYRERKLTSVSFLLWMSAWLLVLVGAVDITLISRLGYLLGIGRGLDLVLIAGLLGAFYLLFKVFIYLEDIKRDMAALAREAALRGEQDENRDSHGVLSKKRKN